MDQRFDFPAVFNNHPSAAFLLAVDGTILEANPAGLRLLEADAVQQAAGCCLYSLVLPGNRDAVREFIGRASLCESGSLEFEVVGLNGHVRWLEMNASAVRIHGGADLAVLGIVRDITRHKLAEEERQAHVWFLESMDRFNRVLQGPNDFEQMLGDALDAVLSIFECDRAWLVHPCDPDAATWRVPMERTRPEYPGAFALGIDVPMEPEIAAVTRLLNGSSGPVMFGPGAEHPVPEGVAREFSVQSFIAMSVHPKSGEPWIFGMHQCSRARTWAPKEERLFQEIGRRLADALTGLLAYRDLWESERRLEEAQRIAHVGHWDRDLLGDRITWSDETCRIFGVPTHEHILDLARLQELVHPDDWHLVAKSVCDAVQNGHRYELEYRVVRPNGEVRIVQCRGDVVKDASGRPVHMFGTVQDITGCRQAGEALRRSQEHLAALIQSVDGIVWEAQAETCQFTFVSPRAERLLGFPASRWTGEPTFWPDHLHPDDRDHIINYCARYTREKRDYELEYRMLAADGRVVWLRDIVSVVVENDRPVKLRGIMVDITAQKQAEHRIERLNRTHAMLSEINQLIVREREPQAILDDACRITVDVGGFPMACLGVVDETADRMKLAAYASSTPDELTALDRALNEFRNKHPLTTQALETGRHAVCNNIECDPQAEPYRDAALKLGYRSMVSLPLSVGGRIIGTFNIHASETGLFDAGELKLLGELAADIGFALEVCEGERARQRALEELRASEERFRELAETIQEVFWVTDPAKSRMLYVSPAYENLWGRSCESLYETPGSWLEAIHPLDRERVIHATTHRQIEGTYDEEYRIIRPDGSIRWIRDQAFVVRDAAGCAERVVGVARDITERKNAQEELRQSQKLEAIGQLAGGVAHDFNNVLVAITLESELLEMNGGLRDEGRNALREIRAAADRAASLTRQLLLFSRRQVMQLRELDLNVVVTHLANMLQRIIGEDVRLQLHLHPAPLVARADAGMLDQLVMNLAVNARDAMPGGGRLLIETSEETVDAAMARRDPDAVPGRYVCLTVTDRGTGIAPEILPRIFEPFFTTKEPGKGTGLGLATVFGITKQHRGWIQVTSQPGEGASFKVFLPASTATVIDDQRNGGRLKSRGGGETILLTEDDPSVRSITRVFLQRHGYEIIEAANGMEALKVWQERSSKVRLLLTDLVMPGGMNGQQLARRLQQDRPQLKVIFASGYSEEIAGRQLELRPGENFLQKPFQPDRLLEIIRSSLDG